MTSCVLAVENLENSVRKSNDVPYLYASKWTLNIIPGIVHMSLKLDVVIKIALNIEMNAEAL